jgi:outer membrane lipoprotein-sorting protein
LSRDERRAHDRVVSSAWWRRRRGAAWLVPAGVGAVAVAGGLLVTAGPSTAVPTLPAKTAQQLLTDVAGSSSDAFSGTVQETASLGLPSLPGGFGSASLSWQSFITGSHTAQVWVDGPARQRIGVLGQLSEAEIVHNGSDVWTYTSATNTATHTVLPAHPAPGDGSGATGRTAEAFDPATAAAQLLGDITPTTTVTVDTAQTVAGRAAYTLVLAPRDSHSTIRSVRIAVDAVHYLPLRVQVFAGGSTPAFQVGFTHISFTTPPASRFTFTVPRGAQVSTDPFVGAADRGATGHKPLPATAAAPGSEPGAPTVIGTGWTAVLELHGATAALPGVAGLPLDKLTTPIGTAGARLLHTSLVNAVLLPDGRIFLGAVDPATLEHVAASTAH